MAIPQELLQQAIALVQSGEKSLSDLKPEFRREVENAMPANYAPGSAPIFRSEPTVTRNLGQSTEPQNTGPNNFIRSAGYTASLPIEGLGQRLNETLGLLGIDQNTTGLPTPESVAARREAAKEFQSTSGDITGSIFSSAPLMAARRFPAVAAGGAIFGGLMPTTENESVLMNMASGAGLASIGQGIGKGVEKVVNRVVRGPANAAQPASGQMTPGQMEGGLLNRLEQQATSVPILGPKIAEARMGSIVDFNKQIINEALEPLGAQVDEAGFAGIAKANQLISNAYDNALDGISTVEVDTAFNVARNKIREELRDTGLASQVELFDNTLKELFDDAVDLTAVNGRAFNEVKKTIAGRAFELTNEGGNNFAASALDDFAEEMMLMLERAAPDNAQLLRQANQAFRLFEPVRRAAGRASSAGRGGIFTPEVLNSNVVARRPVPAAKGQLPMQPQSLRGMEQLGGLGDSRTAERLALLGGGGLLFNNPQAAIAGAGALGLGRMLYSPEAINAYNSMTQRMLRSPQLREFGFKVPPGVAGALGLTAGSELGLLGR